MTTKLLDYDTVLAEFEAICSQYADRELPFIYNRYFDFDGNPSCPVGHWMARHGHTAAEVAPHEGKYAEAAVEALGYRHLNPRVRRLFHNVQMFADRGWAWKRILPVATKEVFSL